MKSLTKLTIDSNFRSRKYRSDSYTSSSQCSLGFEITHHQRVQLIIVGVDDDSLLEGLLIFVAWQWLKALLQLRGHQASYCFFFKFEFHKPIAGHVFANLSKMVRCDVIENILTYSPGTTDNLQLLSRLFDNCYNTLKVQVYKQVRCCVCFKMRKTGNHTLAWIWNIQGKLLN